METRLCYRIEKEAGWGEDEYGNPTEVYSCIKLDGSKTCDISESRYKELVEIGKKLTAGSFDIDEHFITPITLDEYLDNVDEDNC